MDDDGIVLIRATNHEPVPQFEGWTKPMVDKWTRWLAIELDPEAFPPWAKEPSSTADWWDITKASVLADRRAIAYERASGLVTQIVTGIHHDVAIQLHGKLKQV